MPAGIRTTRTQRPRPARSTRRYSCAPDDCSHPRVYQYYITTLAASASTFRCGVGRARSSRLTSLRHVAEDEKSAEAHHAWSGFPEAFFSQFRRWRQAATAHPAAPRSSVMSSLPDRHPRRARAQHDGDAVVAGDDLDEVKTEILYESPSWCSHEHHMVLCRTHHQRE